jgi:thiol:disulfide interchange protein DsbD
MAVAIGYTLTASAPLALCVFAAMGLGLALPFLALSFSPKLLARLPRPGPWMETLRHVLAFPMYAAAGWLAWVFAHQVGVEPLGLLFGAAVALAFALFLFGGAQRREAAGAASVLLGLLTAGVFTAVAVFLAAVAASAPVPPPGATAVAAQATSTGQALSTEPYSAARLAELRSQGRQVFVNFTADWCLTCKVNEAVALSQPQVKAAFAKTHTAYLLGDWTRRDDVIARTLAEHGRAGVPLYLLYRPGAAEPEVLPQLLSAGGVAKALEAHPGGQPPGSVQTASPSIASPAVTPAAPAGDRG